MASYPDAPTTYAPIDNPISTNLLLIVSRFACKPPVYCGPEREAKKPVLDQMSVPIVICTTLPLSWTALNTLAFIDASGLVYTIILALYMGKTTSN